MSSNRHRTIGLMDPPRSEDLQDSQWMQQISQTMRQGMGLQGDKQAKWLTWDDLESNHIVEVLPGGGYAPGGPGGGGGTDPPDLTPPDPLLNLEARGGMTAIRVLWDDPDITYNYRVEVHKAPVDDLGEAFLVGTSQGNIFQDVVGSDTSTWYYWARVIKQVGTETVVGPWNKTEGTPAAAANDPDWVLGDLEGKIDDSHLNDMLSGEIDKIPGIEIDIDGLETGLKTESETRQTEDESLSRRVDTNVSRIGDNQSAIVKESETRATETEALAKEITTLVAEVGENRAAIQTESETRATEDEVLASSITTLRADMDDASAAIRDEMTVIISDQEKLAQRVGTVELDLEDTKGAIEQQFRVVADEFENIRAEYTVKLDVDGYVGGFGLVNDGGVITALWRVDVFGIGAPGCESLAFAVDATLDPPAVVMDGAYIKNATINTAQIGELDVDRLVGGTADWVEANIRDASITNLKIGNVIQSNNYEAGKSGWLLNKAGFLECFQIFARGQIDGSIIRGSVIEGGMLIQSDIQITTPTEADRGPGTTRYLSVVTYSDQSSAISGNIDAQSAKTPTLAIATANYTAEGYSEYGDGNITEPVYNNLNRFLKYRITPTILCNIEATSLGSTRTISYSFRIIGVDYDDSETDLYKSSEYRISLSASQGWYEGDTPFGSWRAYITHWERCQDSECTSYWCLTEVQLTIDKQSCTFNSSRYKGLKARVDHSWIRDMRFTDLSITDKLSNYL